MGNIEEKMPVAPTNSKTNEAVYNGSPTQHFIKICAYSTDYRLGSR